MPKKFDRSIRALKQERFRMVGKAIAEYSKVPKEMLDPFLALKSREVIHLDEAIEILEKHLQNKHV